MKKTILRSVLAACLLGASALASAQVAVIVHADATQAPSKAEVANIFLGKDKSMKAVDQSGWNDTKGKFYSDVASRNESQLKSYWSSLVFTGKGQPLPSVATDADVVSFVAGDKSAIGYVDAGSVKGGVKVLFTLP